MCSLDDVLRLFKGNSHFDLKEVVKNYYFNYSISIVLVSPD